MQTAVNEADWRLFRSRLPEWLEAHMARLSGEYVALLCGPGSASDKFRALEKRIGQDREACGIRMRMSRTNMDANITALLANGVIGPDDLDGFSDEFRARMKFITGKP